jgi:hypothetical protein
VIERLQKNYGLQARVSVNSRVQPIKSVAKDEEFPFDTEQVFGGVSNVDMDGNNALYIKAIQVFISTFETLPANPRP